MQDSRRDKAEEAGNLPKWPLQMLSQDEQEGLLRLSVFPLAITMDMATCVLPSTCKLQFCCCCCSAEAFALLLLMLPMLMVLFPELPVLLLLLLLVNGWDTRFDA